MALIETLAPFGVTALIFGGCCTNVYALEAILKHEPDSGLLITLLQFILVTLSVYPSQRPVPKDGDSSFILKKPRLPFASLLASAAMFYGVNMLNNWAFAFDISVPVHIILRSFGSVTTMAAGWLRGKRHSRIQILSVVMLTAGVVISAWADAMSKGKSMDLKLDTTQLRSPHFELGLAVLLVAQVLSAWMGIFVQDVYAVHGAHWRENLFYSHAMSLPMFMPLAGVLRQQYARLCVSPPYELPSSLGLALPTLPLPASVVYLAVNSITQLLCITGVNMLSAKCSAVTVTIVLNIRKLVSFILSVWLFGNPMSGLMMFGAGLVFGSGALYGWETSWRLRRKREAAVSGKAANGSVHREKEL